MNVNLFDQACVLDVFLPPNQGIYVDVLADLRCSCYWSYHLIVAVENSQLISFHGEGVVFYKFIMANCSGARVVKATANRK